MTSGVVGFVESSEAADSVASSFPGSQALSQAHLVLAVVRSQRQLDLFAQLPEVRDWQILNVPRLRVVAGLDLMARIEVENRNETSTNGTAPGDDGGYPIWKAGAPEGQQVDIDGELNFPTRQPVVAAVNMSFGPKEVGNEYNALRDAINWATRAISGTVLPVAAAGNESRSADGRATTSEWAKPQWVVSVGATADRGGQVLASYSSTGSADDPGSGPDVVSIGEPSLNSEKRGTSFAAPRVADAAADFACALLCIRHVLQRVTSCEVQGVPVVGIGIIDRDFDLPHEPLRLNALPVFGINEKVVADLASIAEDLRINLDLTPSPSRLRRALLTAVRPMMNYPSHQVGAGFIDRATVKETLRRLSIGHILAILAHGPIERKTLASLPTAPLFDPQALNSLVSMWHLSRVIWTLDYKSGRFTSFDGTVHDGSA